MLEDWWERYEPYADASFRQGFADDPEARIWELRLGVFCLDAGLALVKTSDRGAKKTGGPDLLIDLGDRRLWIEAVAPQLGERWKVDEFGATAKDVHDEAPDYALSAGEGWLNDDELVLRHLAGLRDKARKFASYRKQGICGPRDFCVVAISDGRFAPLSNGADDFPHIAYALLPMGPLSYVFSRDGLVSSTRARADLVPKGQTGVPRGAFFKPEYEAISGVISGRMGFPLDGWVSSPELWRNPNARRPLPPFPGVFRRDWSVEMRSDGAFRLRETQAG